MGQNELAQLWHLNADRLFACLRKPLEPRELIEVVASATRPTPGGVTLTSRPWKVGTWVYARRPGTDAWTSGFAVAEVLADGYRLRRIWEGDLLDGVTPFEDVRPERRIDPFGRAAGTRAV